MAMDFPGLDADDRAVDLGTLDLGALGALSFTVWFNLDQHGPDESQLFAKGDSTANDKPWAMQVEDDETLRAIFDLGAGGEVLDGVTAISTGVWHFGALTWDGATKRLYLDDAEEANEAATGTLVTGTGEQVYLAAVEATTIRREMDGLLEDMRIYDRALSVNELLTMYQLRGADGIVHGLLHRWRMNEGAENAVASGAGGVKDLAAGQFNGTAVGSPTYEAGILI